MESRKKKKKQKNLVLKRRWFKQKEAGDIEDYYEFSVDKDVLGTGTYGSVMKAMDKRTKQIRAIKVIPKSRVTKEERFKTEIEILRNLDHPNIIKLFETFEDARNIYLVMEMCGGGELFDRIIEQGHFTEEKARDVFQQMMMAINYMHSNKIAHRDLKPENFLYMTKEDDSPLKIIDFGLSKVFGADVFDIEKTVEEELKAEGKKIKKKRKRKRASMKTRAGTPYYIAPEVLAGDYDESCDIWSAGVILYIILCGYPPFYGNTDREILFRVQKGVFDFDGEEWLQHGDEVKNLIRAMITTPEKRLTAMEIMQHSWVKTKKRDKPLKINLTKFKDWKSLQKLKKIALTVIASQLNTTEITELEDLFNELDENKDGSLTVDEIKAGLKKSDKKGDKMNKIQKIFDSIDTDKSGKIDYTEFIAVTMEKKTYLQEEKIHAAFKLFDKEGDGQISAQELKDVLGADECYKEKQMIFWEDMIKEADVNKDGRIDYNEFLIMMKNIS